MTCVCWILEWKRKHLLWIPICKYAIRKCYQRFYCTQTLYMQTCIYIGIIWICNGFITVSVRTPNPTPRNKRTALITYKTKNSFIIYVHVHLLNNAPFHWTCENKAINENKTRQHLIRPHYVKCRNKLSMINEFAYKAE